MAVTWVIYGNGSTPLGTQPPSGSPLALKFNEEGYPHLDNETDLIVLVEGDADGASTVTIELTPDAGAQGRITLSRTQSRPVPDSNFTWTDGANGLVTLVFNVPPVGGPDYYEWVFGNEPPVALKMNVKVRR